MHCRRVVATAFQFHRQRNGIRHVGDAHDGQHRHHQFGHGKRMFCGGFYKQQSRLFRNFKADCRRDFRRIATNPVTADGAFSALVDIFQQHRLQLLRLLCGQFHRMLAFHQTHQFIGYAINNNQYLFVGTNDVVIERRAFDDGLSSTGEVGGFIHHYRRVASACGNQTFIGVFARRFHYRFAAGHHQQADTRKLEQALRGFDIRICYGNQ
ncbi:hypothetical protein HmCmsJML291_01220 [Escherichia coli]|nr:hypothetical protein HmCmsJML291_01220 [Escherichia coli]